MSAAAGAAALLALGLAGCNGMMNSEDFPEDGPTRTATSNPQDVSADDFGHSWNLDVDRGTVSCEKNGKGDPVLRFTAPDGTEYALNSVDENAELPPIGDISDGSIGTLRTFAFTVCDA
ncbi:hypothetical protein ACFSE6_11910 [Georgenia deserti]|uniref:Superoxide dismutase n=2 Tax=Georgenia deserti TaxID=2093781 RepID=A0ABW4L923_9MICO